MRGGEGVGTSCPKSPPGQVPALGQAPNTLCQDCYSSLPAGCPSSTPVLVNVYVL